MYAMNVQFNTPNTGLSRKARRRIIAALRLFYALVIIAKEILS